MLLGVCYSISRAGNRWRLLYAAGESLTVRDSKRCYLHKEGRAVWVWLRAASAEMIMSLEFEILRRVPRANSRITDLNFEEQILTSAGTCSAGSHWEVPWRAKGFKRAGWSKTASWNTGMDCCLVQRVKQAWQNGFMDELYGLCTKTVYRDRSRERPLKKMWRHCLLIVRMESEKPSSSAIQARKGPRVQQERFPP